MARQPIPEVDPSEVQRRLDTGEPMLLLDCREPKELALARIAGAHHVPMGDVPAHLQRLDPEVPIVVFCHAGVRSLSVAHFLIQQDFQAASMRGGIDAWSQTIDPTVPRY